MAKNKLFNMKGGGWMDWWLDEWNELVAIILAAVLSIVIPAIFWIYTDENIYAYSGVGCNYIKSKKKGCKNEDYCIKLDDDSDAITAKKEKTKKKRTKAIGLYAGGITYCIVFFILFVWSACKSEETSSINYFTVCAILICCFLFLPGVAILGVRFYRCFNEKWAEKD